MFWIFNKNKKQVKSENNNNSSNDNEVTKLTIGTFINFLLEEEKNNNITLGKTKDNAIFIQFKNEKIDKFIKQWFSVMKMKSNNEISNDFYENFVNELIKEFSSVKNKEEVIKSPDGKIIEINGESYMKLN